MPLNANTENARIEKFIGAPVDIYDSGEDQLCVNVYNYFKPAIFHFFYLANNPYKDDHRDQILTIMRDFKSFGDEFLGHAAGRGVIPGAPFNENWVERWFDDIFPNEATLAEFDLSVVIQGGEAVNYYTQYKYDNVPTHDADTRVLAGRHFNYTKRLQEVNPTAKEYMHKYRFFLVYCLISALDMFHDANLTLAGMANPDETPYVARFLPNWADLSVTYSIEFSTNIDFDDVFLDDTYDMNQDYYLERLLSLTVILMEGEDEGTVNQCSIVDFFCPYKRLPTESPTYRVGQSDNIFSYFGTEQANNLLRALPTPAGNSPQQPILNERGHVPSLDIELILPNGAGLLGEQTIDVRLLPLGYTLFETIRMLLVSEVLERHNLTHKLMKYKQKLNVLLGTLMNETLTEFVFGQNLIRKAKDPNMNRVLSGGANEIEGNSRPRMSPKPMISPEVLREARAYSKQLQMEKYNRREGASSTPAEEEEQDLESMSEAQRLGYMDFLSYEVPDFKDARLPLDPAEIRQKYMKAMKKHPPKKVNKKNRSNTKYRNKTPQNNRRSRNRTRRTKVKLNTKVPIEQVSPYNVSNQRNVSV